VLNATSNVRPHSTEDAQKPYTTDIDSDNQPEESQAESTQAEVCNRQKVEYIITLFEG